MFNVLIAGFEGYSDRGEGSSAGRFVSKATEFSSEDRCIQSISLPLVWERSFEVLLPVLSQDWDAILLFGTGSATALAVEKLALNESDVSLKDSEGRRPRSKQIVAEGEPGYWTGLPFRDLAINLTAAGIRAVASHHAGGFVPNQVFYRLMHWLECNRPSTMGGLIRVPESLDALGDFQNLALSCILDTVSKLSESPDRLGVDVAKLRGLHSQQ